MRNEQPDPELIRLLRSAGWLWIGYLTTLMGIDWFLYRMPLPVLFYYAINGFTALTFLGLAYWRAISRWIKSFYLPLMLMLIVGLPLVANNLILNGLRSGMSSPEGMALRQLPVLFVALVITAWQYRLAGVILFSVCTALLELLMVIFVAPLFVFVAAPTPGMLFGFSPMPFRSIDIFLFLTMVRTVSFGVVGFFISQLMSRLRLQQNSLTDANSRLRHYASTLESLTVSRERNRMAHELHDTLAHSLTALSVQLEAVKAYWSLDRRKSRQLLEQSLSATRSGLVETRRALKSLRATPLEELGLLLALRQLASFAAARASLELELSLPGELISLSPDVEQCIYRIAQEAIENVLTHAGARSLGVGITQENQIITLTVHDDGVGFDPAEAGKSDHFGLMGMKERSSMAGGELMVESAPGKGTTITLSIGSIQ